MANNIKKIHVMENEFRSVIISHLKILNDQRWDLPKPQCFPINDPHTESVIVSVNMDCIEGLVDVVSECNNETELSLHELSIYDLANLVDYLETSTYC